MSLKKLVGVLIIQVNVREPIVNSPDIFKCFMNTEMDFLVIGNFFYEKKNQKINFSRIGFKKD